MKTQPPHNLLFCADGLVVKTLSYNVTKFDGVGSSPTLALSIFNQIAASPFIYLVNSIPTSAAFSHAPSARLWDRDGNAF